MGPRRGLIPGTAACLLLASGAGAPRLAAPAAVGDGGGAALSSLVSSDLERARNLTQQGHYAEAIAALQAAIGGLRVLAQPSSPAADLAILAIFGDAETGVSVVVTNRGTAAAPAPVLLYLLPAGGGNPVPLTTISTPMSLPAPLGAGETRTVKSRPFGCGATQRVRAKVDPHQAVVESDERNNESTVLEVRPPPCSS